MNVKETLKRLHKKFPLMSLDELFEILDCYIEQSSLSTTQNWQPNKIWYSTNTISNVDSEINCLTSQSEDFENCAITVNNCNDVKIKYYDGVCFEQSTANH